MFHQDLHVWISLCLLACAARARYRGVISSLSYLPSWQGSSLLWLRANVRLIGGAYGIFWLVHLRIRRVSAQKLKSRSRILPSTVVLSTLIISKLLCQLFLLLLVKPDVIQNAQILEEVVFITILGKHLKDANHLIVSFFNELVEERHCRVVYHT